MGAIALNCESYKYTEMYEYLTSDTDFWIKNDIWKGNDAAFNESEIPVQEKVKNWIIADFTTFVNENLKLEIKYFILKQLKTGELTVAGCSANYCRAIRNIGKAIIDYVWNSYDEEYVPYLYDEITKTGIPLHKIPIRPEVAQMVSGLIEDAKAKSTDENNPDKYLFNTYEGKCKGLPYSKPAFASVVNELIARKKIRDGLGQIYHFKTHSLRHTRALEYTEQGMPIGIIQQILGHCSLQMTLHYSKISEDMLYKKWQKTEKLDLFKPSVEPPDKNYQHTEEIHYEHVRKNLDVVKVPFGTCFKPSKIGCKNQTQMCLDCTSFCSTKEDLPAYEAEIKRVEALILVATKTERIDWIEKNKQYLNNLMRMRDKILQEGIVHKNGKLREETDG